MGNGEWPQETLSPNDSLLRSVPERWHLNACIGPQLDEHRALEAYADGFRAAARRLADECVTSNNTMDFPLDVVVYPLAFLYRHHFELLLKQLLRECDIVDGGHGSFPSGHKLLALWEQARTRVESVLQGPDWSQNETVTALFTELESVDPTGQAARYPHDTRGNKSFSGHPLLNVEHFAETADRLSDYLQTLLTGVVSRREEGE